MAKANADGPAAPSTDRALESYSMFDPQVVECPFQYWKALRGGPPVFRDPTTGFYVVSRYDLVGRVLKDPKTFSSRFGPALGGGPAASDKIGEIAAQGYPPVDTMLTADPPAHTRYRKLVNQAFTARRVESLGPRIDEIARTLIDTFSGGSEVELLSAFAQPLPLMVIAEQLGVPLTDMGQFRDWSDAFVTQLSGFADEEAAIDAARKIVQFQRYFAEKLEEKRHQPTDDIISDLVHARVEDERPLDVAEMLSILQQLLVAGNETTAAAITEGIHLLVSHPAVMEMVRADRNLIANLTEEVLRLSSPTSNMFRVATCDTQIEGIDIPKGSLVLVRFGAANRDETQFTSAEQFDVGRPNARSHLAFGLGIHTCLGASLARKEMTIAFNALLDRLSRIEFVDGRNDFRHSPSMLLRGLSQLWISFECA